MNTLPVVSSPRSAANTGSGRQSDAPALHLVWVFAAPLATRLDSATWLETTRELRALGWQVTLINMGPAGAQVYRDVETLCIPKRDYYFLGQFFFHLDVVRFILRRWGEIDVILFNQNSGIWLLPLRLLRGLQGKKRPQIVMDTRDLNDARPGSVREWLRNRYMRLNNRLANLFADGQTTITPRFVDMVGIPKRQLWGIWPSGVNPEPFAAAAVKRCWPAHDEAVRLVYIGVLLEKRHPIQLCRAVQRALDLGMAFELHFYGDGPEAAQVRQCAEKSNGHIRLMPPIAHDDVPDMLARMHVGVTSLPRLDDAKYAASSPVKLFEYLASGLPLLATSNVCHTDVVGESAVAFWVEEPTEAGILETLELLWDERAHLPEMSTEAQDQVRNWTWSAAAEKLDRALRQGLADQTTGNVSNPRSG